MSRKNEPTLHVEWSPTHVVVEDPAHGRTTEGRTLADAGIHLNGHRQALVGVSRGHVLMRTLRLPRADAEDLRRLVEVQLAQLFPLPPDQLAFDCLQTGDCTAEGCLTLVAAMRTEDLERLRSDLGRAGLAASRIAPVSFGAAQLVTAAGLSDALVVERSAAGLALDVVQSGAVRLSRMVPPGTDATDEARRTLAAAGAPDLPVVAGSGVDIPGAVRAPVTALSALTGAIPFHLDLAEERQRKRLRRARASVRIATALLVLSIAVAAVVWMDSTGALTAANQENATWARTLGRMRSRREAATQRAQKAAAVANTLRAAFEPGQRLSDAVGVAADAVPQGVWLTALSVDRGGKLSVRGTALDSDAVGRYVSALTANPRFRDVQLVYANVGRILEVPVVQFNVSATVTGNLPLPEPTKRGKRATRATTASGGEEGAAR